MSIIMRNPLETGVNEDYTLFMSRQTAKNYIDQLTANGEISFTKKHMQVALGITAKAAENAIARLRHKHEIASPAKGFYLILTPEFRKLGCLPPDYFIDELMHYEQQRYYVSLLSAALYYGAAHQQPQILQVMIDRYRKPIICGQVKIEFITQKNLADAAVTALKTHTGNMNISTSEQTLIDLLRFMRRSNGINRIVTVVDELIETVDPENLRNLLQMDNELTWMQRLGYILEYLGHTTLAAIIDERLSAVKTNFVPLVPYYSMAKKERNAKWRVIINVPIEEDSHDSY